MDLLKTISLVILFILAPLLASDRTRLIITQTGDDCVLQCQCPESREVKLLKWTRADLHTESYVFLYRDGRVLDHHHHSSFSNRVQLRDPELKTGNLSVVLKNVTREDTGMYRCSALFETSEGRQKILQYTELIVTEPEQKAKQHSGGGATASPGPEPGSALAVIVPVVVSLLIIAVVSAGVIIYCRKNRLKTQTKTPKKAEKEDMSKILTAPQSEE